MIAALVLDPIGVAIDIILVAFIALMAYFTSNHRRLEKSREKQREDEFEESLREAGLRREPISKNIHFHNVSFNRTTHLYWCVKCSELLSKGPEGGCAVNAVCRKCNTNFGCLPGFYGFGEFSGLGGFDQPIPLDKPN